jgi:hypothetical protein
MTNILPFYTADERKIVKEIKAWSRTVLEKPNIFFNKLAPCPYAKKAWLNDKVNIIFKHDKHNQIIYSAVSLFPETTDMTIIVDTEFEEDPDEFHDYLLSMNEGIADGIFIDRDIWVMGAHPYDDEADFVGDLGADFEAESETMYALIFVQRLSKLENSADKLQKSGYYEQYLGETDAPDMYQKRSELYGRLKDGDKDT